jgi:serine protease Do
VKKKITMTEKINTALEALSRKILPALVVVKSHRHRAGAGVIWHADGLILTNHHVLGKRSAWVQIEDGRNLQAKVLADEADLDLALLQIPVIGLPAIEVEEDLPRVGELVFAFGHPWGQRGMITSGVISALVSAQTQARRSLTLLRTDVPLAPGSSGGPLVSARGKMVGINNMVVGGDQSVAIPAQTIRSFVDNVLAAAQDQEWRQEV